MADYSLLTRLPEPLLRWYHENRRILPWREDPHHRMLITYNILSINDLSKWWQ